MTPEAKRAQLVREAEALKDANGNFADDAARQAFDAKMAEVDALDASIRGQSEFLRQSNALEPDAGRLGMATERAQEPNEADIATRAERTRVQGITNAVRAARLPSKLADKLIAEGLQLVDAQSRIFDEMSRQVDPNGAPQGRTQNPVQFGDDPFVHERAGIENAILHRVNPTAFKLDPERGRKYRAMTLLEVAKVYLNARGIRTTEMSKNEIAGLAMGLNQRTGYHTTSDFALLLADVASKTLRQEYAAAPQTFTAFSRRTTLPDYKPSSRLNIGEAPSLLKVEEHGEYTHGTIGEGREQMQLAKYGRKFAITREALINDDTDSFSRVPMKFGRAARNLESNLVWLQLLSNPVMGDNVVLFHADHNNLDAVGSAISVTSVGAARAAMRLQTAADSDGITYIDVSPRYLIVPPSLETIADQFVNPIQPGTTADVNPFGGRLTVISEPRLETGIGSVAGSALSWYLVAAGEGGVDLIEYAYLEGEEGPQVESRTGFDIDGLEIKCRLDFAAKVVDYRGFYKNVGAEIT